MRLNLLVKYSFDIRLNKLGFNGGFVVYELLMDFCPEDV